MLMAMAMPNPQSSLALKQAAKKLQAEHHLKQISSRRVGVGGDNTRSGYWLRCWETPSLEDMISDFIEPARELDLLTRRMG